MSRVTAVFDDLLLGSNVLGWLRQAGHEALLVSRPEQMSDQPDVLIVDLGSTGFDGIAALERLAAGGRLEGVKTVGVYSHVQHEVRSRARAAGFDLVVPRSRLAREGPELIARLTDRAAG